MVHGSGCEREDIPGTLAGPVFRLMVRISIGVPARPVSCKLMGSSGPCPAGYSAAMDHALAARLVAQHAQTTRLLGVDFLPAYCRGQVGEADQAVTMPVAPMPDSGMEPKPMVVGPVASASRVVSAEASSIANAASAAPGPKPTDRGASRARLDALRARYEADAPHKHFITHFTNIVFGEGDPCARLMFIGEAPGEQEDLTGRPFVGRAGQLLDKMIVAMGLRREDVYIANVLKTRPPNNATPTAEEARLCAPYLFEQIDIIAPEAIVTLGLPATRVLLDTMESMTRLRGLWAKFTTPSGRVIPVMPTYHPAYLLRAYTPENRAKVWSDLQKVIEKLGLPKPARSQEG